MVKENSKTLVIIVFILCIISQLSTSAKKRQNMVLKNCGNVYEIVDTFFFNRLDSIISIMDFSEEIPHEYYYVTIYQYNSDLIDDSIFERTVDPKPMSIFGKSLKYESFLRELPDSFMLDHDDKYIIVFNVTDDIFYSEIMAESKYIYQLSNCREYLINKNNPINTLCKYKLNKLVTWFPTHFVLIYDRGHIYLYDTFTIVSSRLIDAPNAKKENRHKHKTYRSRRND